MENKISFMKFNGTGNDFIILDNREKQHSDDALRHIAKSICRRGLALGADGVLVVELSKGVSDFTMRLFNADGSEGEMCGNGARCIARYAYMIGIAGEKMSFDTLAGRVTAYVCGRDVSIQLNDPTTIELEKKVIHYDREIECTYIELGNPGLPHVVVEQPDLGMISNEKLTEYGRSLRYHHAFPKGANINFYKLYKDQSVLVRTYERGVEGLTMACGTGAASTALTLILKGKIRGPVVKIDTMGGELKIEVQQVMPKVRGLYLHGSTTLVAEGFIFQEVMQA
ncbi:MAG: diaminopimelate epimerase [Bacillota bacterium]